MPMLITTGQKLAGKGDTMAKIHAQVIGGVIKEIEADSVKAAKEMMGANNYTATVNGEPSTDDQSLSDYDFVALAPAVKGA